MKPIQIPIATFGVLILLTGSFYPQAVRAKEPATQTRVTAHRVSARFDPPRHRIIASDTLTLASSPAAMRVALDLAPTLKLRKVTLGESDAPLPAREKDGQFTIDIPAGTTSITLSYDGEIFDAVKREDDLAWVVGDDTKGVISEEGVYLSGASRWIPRLVDQRVPTTFELETWIPAPFLVVTQGGVPKRSEIKSDSFDDAGNELVPTPAKDKASATAATWHHAIHPAGIPTDSVALSAGDYEVNHRDVEGVRLATYFFRRKGSGGAKRNGNSKSAGNSGYSSLWLDSAAETVKRYTPILGKYPHRKFDIVENFFQSGYGMPSYTLLGNRVIAYVSMKARRSGGKIPPGYLDHEYVHGWFGNGLLVDYASGNWCEAFTTYYSNYLAQELESTEKARDYRRAVLEKYTLRINPEKDYPIRNFVTKTEDFDNDIGYGKGSMFVHQLRRHLDLEGEGTFFKRMRAFTQSRMGTVVRWPDLLEALLGNDQDAFLPYLDRSGLPQYRIRGSRATKKDSGWQLVVDIEQVRREGEITWPGTIDVQITGKDAGGKTQQETRTVTMKAGHAHVSWDMKLKPTHVTLDPDAHALRSISKHELPACLNATLESPGDGMVVVRGPDQLFGRLAQRFAEQKGFRVVKGDFDVEHHRGPVVTFSIQPGADQVAGVRLREPHQSILFSTRTVDGHPRTHYVATSPSAAARVGYAPFYGWDTRIVFERGRPIDRSVARTPSSDTHQRLTSRAETIRDDIRALAAMPRGAPWPPQEKDAKQPLPNRDDVYTFINRQLALPSPLPAIDDNGQDPHAFRVSVPWIANATLSYKSDANAGQLIGDPSVCRPLSFSAEAGRGSFDPVGEAKGSVHLVSLETTSIDALYKSAVERERAGAKAVVFVLGSNAWNAVRPWLDSVSKLTSESEAELAKPGRSGKPRPRPDIGSWILGKRARSKRVDGAPLSLKALKIPVVAIKASAMPNEQSSTINLSVRMQREALALRNIVGVWARKGPVSPKAKPRAWVVMAHFDTPVKEGVTYPGADDNASGVACVLELARALKAYDAFYNDKDAINVSHVIFAFPDGEERGLLGSRHLVKHLTGRFQIQGVINVDSVGRATSKSVHVIGASVHKDLGQRLSTALEGASLKLGKNIDRFAFPHGSDHWPFHEAGIPAVSLWASDYRIMNTAADTPEKVEPDGIAKIVDALLKVLNQ